MLVLSSLGVVAAVALFYIAKQFKVVEDPRIDDVEKMLPGANCGGCGFAGCRGFASAMVQEDDISNLYCPVGGAEAMKAAASYLGKEAAEKDRQTATILCGGSCAVRPQTSIYDGAKSCAVAASLYVGQSDCAYGCLGLGDCVTSCDNKAISISPETGLPVVDPELCSSCGACVRACPKSIIELRKKMPKNRAVYVACSSKDKGAVAMKACKSSCIGCSKCVKACPFEAITVSNNVAYIDPLKCKLCRKCIAECPTGAIALINMEPLPKAPKVAPAPKSPVVKAQATAPESAKPTEVKSAESTKVE